MASVNDHENRIKKIEDSLMKVISFTKNITITSRNWVSTGIKLSSGTYIVKVSVNTHNNGGSQWYETYSGICSYYSGSTHDNNLITEFPLHSAGHHTANQFICLGFKRSNKNAEGYDEIMIASTENITDCPIQFYFRKVF